MACKNQMKRCTELQVPVSFLSLVFLKPLMATSQYRILPYFTLVEVLQERGGHRVDKGRDRVVQRSF